MLAEISIENFAIIDALLVRFDPGLTVLTGETGAGKSIIVDALQAALGARVPSDVVRSDARAAVVEAVFDLPSGPLDEALAEVFEEYGLDDEVIILRREIGSSGRSSARLNGRAVPVAVIQRIAALLVDIHGQSDHLSILRRDRQLDALDRYGDLQELRTQVAEAIRAYDAARRALEDLVAGRREAEQRLDLLRFQVQEIESAQLVPNEDDELEVERNLLANAEKLSQLAGAGYDALRGEDAGAVDRVLSAVEAAKGLAEIDPMFADRAERLEAAQYELEDLSQELRAYRDGVDVDPRRLDAVEERLALLTRLQRKYGPSLEEVIECGARARSELDDVENVEERLAELEQRVRDAGDNAGCLAGELSRSREEAAKRLTAAMAKALSGLGLKSAEFQIELTVAEVEDGLQLPEREARVAYSANGVDVVTFLVTFNPGEPLRPLERVASGGETSRFLLALKSVLAAADRVPTLIFDEVDVGVGGRSGAVVGDRLRQLAGSHQVISITHLPQIAALADHHLWVGKRPTGGRTVVQVRDLVAGDRVAEIAQMMSGTGTEAARRSAEELLQAARGGAERA